MAKSRSRSETDGMTIFMYGKESIEHGKYSTIMGLTECDKYHCNNLLYDVCIIEDVYLRNLARKVLVIKIEDGGRKAAKDEVLRYRSTEVEQSVNIKP